MPGAPPDHLMESVTLHPEFLHVQQDYLIPVQNATFTIKDVPESFIRAVTADLVVKALQSPATSLIADKVTVPMTWWDAVKKRFFPAILLDWFPPEMRTITTTIEVRNICPHLISEGRSVHVKFLTPQKPSAPPRPGDQWPRLGPPGSCLTDEDIHE